MPQFNFVGSAYQAASIYQDDQESINWYPEVDLMKPMAQLKLAYGVSQGVRGVIALYPTPGLLLKGTLPQGPLRGFRVIPGGNTLYAVAGNKLYAVNTLFGYTEVGTLLTRTGPVNISDNGLSLYLTDGNNRYAYTWASNTFTTITDGAFTSGVGVDIIDNYLVYSAPNSQQWGATNADSIISTGLSFASKDGSSDYLMTLIVSDRQVYLLGEKTTECWVDAGLFPFPFERIPGSNSQHGCIAPYSVARLGGSFAWLARDDRGQGIVAQMNGYEPVRISTHAIENAIASYAIVSDATAYTYQQEGHEFYVLNFPSADVTWVYDAASSYWHKRAWRDSNNVLHRHRVSCVVPFQGMIIGGDFQNGNLYSLDRSVYTDNGDTILRLRRAPHITNDLQRTFYHDLQIQFQPGVGLSDGSTPQAMLRWSDDGGSTYGNIHPVSIGKQGEYKNRAIWRRLGWARDRIFEVSVTDPVNAVIISSNLNFSLGAN